MRAGDIAERNHRAALAVLHRLRFDSHSPDDRLIFVRRFWRFGSAAWKVAHQSGAAAYIPYGIIARYGDIYELQQVINDSATSTTADLQSAMSVLNTQAADRSREEEESIQRDAENADAQSPQLDSGSEAAWNEIFATLSGHPDLSRLTPAQVDHLEQAFQEAITNDRRLHRLYVALKVDYASLAN